MRRVIATIGVLSVVGVAGLNAQATGTAYNAPYRVFEQHEFGGTLSFANSITGIEGVYRFAYQKFDIGARGGVLTGNNNTNVILGVEGRGLVIEQTDAFPLDGAVIVGLGTSEFDSFLIPGGLSLGRRFDFEDSPIKLTAYAQPTLFLAFGSGNSDLGFGLGLGADVTLSTQFDIRASFGLGDYDRFAISAVWFR